MLAKDGEGCFIFVVHEIRSRAHMELSQQNHYSFQDI